MGLFNGNIAFTLLIRSKIDCALPFDKLKANFIFSIVFFGILVMEKGLEPLAFSLRL